MLRRRLGPKLLHGMKKRHKKQKRNNKRRTIVENNNQIENKEKKGFWKAVYSVISFISTVSVLGVFLYAIIGCFFEKSYSDNDIILTQINKQIEGNEKIMSIKAVDIHGFGDESLIVVTGDNGFESSYNRVLILEKLTNGFWSKVFNPFGFGSDYIIKFSFHNDDYGILEYTDIEYVGNITSRVTKDIVISYNSKSSTFGARDYIIISYSTEDQKYHIIGTYPPVYKVEGIARYNEDGTIYSIMPQKVCEEEITSDNSFEPQYSDLCVPVWINSPTMGRELMVVNTYKGANECMINIYYPWMENGKLEWYVDFSEYFDDFTYRDTYSPNKLLEMVEKKLPFADYTVVE